MFNSYVVELVIGLCFLFAVLGIVTSAITEAILQVSSIRSKHLQEWLKQWTDHLLTKPLVDSKLVSFSLDALLSHPLVASQIRAETKPEPKKVDASATTSGPANTASYLSSEQLAAAFLQVLVMPFSETCIGKELDKAEQGLRGHIGGLQTEELKHALNALLDCAASKAKNGTELVEALRIETEKWINSSMDRVEGWTKRSAKKWSLLVAFAVCLAFNVDALEVIRVLSSDTQVRSQMASTAVGYVGKACDTAEAGGETPKPKVASNEELVAKLNCLNNKAEDAVSSLGHLSNLGIGWDKKPAFMSSDKPADKRESSTWGWLCSLLGWLAGLTFSTFAASLGGDFWFKWIGDVVRLTGYKPTRKEDAAPEKTT